MTLHVLKTNRAEYEQILNGRRSDLRLNDRDYQPEDTVTLRERDPKTGRYTGRQQTYVVSDVLRRPERYWPLSDIERHGLALLTLAAPTVAYSDLNPYRAAEGARAEPAGEYQPRLICPECRRA